MDTPHIYSVAELNRRIKLLLEENLPALWVEGEVSNHKAHYSGHLYFTLKDADSQISCVMWRTRAAQLALDLQDGQRVRILGYVRVYDKAGRYQLDCLQIEAAGIGDLQRRFEELKQKLLEEGLFDQRFKKPVPRYPGTVGIITSTTGAAVRDIMSVIRRRSPATQMIIHGVKVQGEGAADEIVSAIEVFNRYGKADVLIVGRGGGSIEDLWPFNEERVARAVFKSEIPVISAVGHEVDYTITDFVADMRAPTPSAAAELAVPGTDELKIYLLQRRNDIGRMIHERLRNRKQRILEIVRSYAFRRPPDIINQYFQRLDELADKLRLLSGHVLANERAGLDKLKEKLESLNPVNVLSRGYAMVYKDRKLLRSVSMVEIGDVIQTRLFDGDFESRIIEGEYGKET